MRRTKDGAVIDVRAKRGKGGRIPGELRWFRSWTTNSHTRLVRFPAAAKRRSPTGGLAAWSPQRGYSLAPTETELRAAHGNTESCVPSYRPASTPNAARSALGHGLRDAFATELANSEVSVYTLMILLGQESRARPTRALTCHAAHGCPRPPHCHPASKVASRCPGS